MTDLADELERLTTLLAGLGFDFAASFFPGISRDETQAVLDSYLSLPSRVTVPEEVFEWTAWQNGARWAERRDDPSLVQSIAPGLLAPMSLPRSVELIRTHEPWLIANDAIVPLFGGPNRGYAYRLAADNSWHLSMSDSKETFWTTPEDLDATDPNSEYLVRNRLNLIEWVTELNNAIADGRLIRGDYNDIRNAINDESYHSYPWRPT